MKLKPFFISFLSQSRFSLGICLWSFLRLLNNKLYRSYERKQVEFNLPSHMLRLPVCLQYIQIFIDFYMLLLSSPLRRFPRVQSERIFIGTVCLLSLNIVSLFQSSLATVFIKPMYYKNIDTLQEFADTRQKIVIKYPAMLTDLFPEDSSELFRTLHDRMFVVAEPETTALKVINKGFATVTRKTTLKLMKEDTLVHLVPECPRSYNLAYVLAANSVYLEKVNSIILDINRFGIIGKWIAEANYKVELENMKINPPASNRPRVFKISDMQLPFIILLFGTFVAFIVFVIEKVLSSKLYTTFEFIA